jgi:pimeloyl-ACP methyl ester carboxylesterase
MYPSLEVMASAYMKVLLAQQPVGPYRLGGWSLGAVVAFELANQLRTAGHEVTALILFDPERPLGALARWSRRARRALSRWRYRLSYRWPAAGLLIPGTKTKLAALRELSPVRRLGRWLQTLAYLGVDDHPVFIEHIFPGMFDPKELAGLRPDALWDLVYRRAKAQTNGGSAGDTLDLQYGIPGTSAASTRQRARVFAEEHHIEAAYVPRSVYPGRVTMFMQRGSRHGPVWGNYTSLPLEVHLVDLKPTATIRIPHNAMMQEANVAGFADAFRAVMEKTRSL